MAIHTIDMVRQKQTRKYAFKAFLLVFIFLGLVGGGYYYANHPASKGSSTNDTSSAQLDTGRTPSLLICNSIESSNSVSKQLSEWNPDNFEVSVKESVEDCDVNLSRNLDDTSQYSLAWSRLYIPVTRFDSTIQELTSQELETGLANQQIKGMDIIWDENTDDFMKSKYNTVVGQQFRTAEQIHDQLVSSNKVIAIIPFDEAKPLYKILPIDDQTPLHKDFNPTVYPLTDTYWVKGSDSDLTDQLKTDLKAGLGDPNYEMGNTTDVILTGTSVVGGRTHFIVINERGDNLFPIRGIADTLREADIAHLSNEASFSPNCDQSTYTLVFCGTLDSFEMLTFAGIDIVGLTGNHIRDYGTQALLDTLDLFTKNNLVYFGGGKDFDDAHTPKVIKVNGIKIAFVGFNFIPPADYYATATLPGNAAPNQYGNDKKYLNEDIEKAKSEADFVIVDMQWGQEYINYAIPEQQEYGRAAIDAGADIINGVHPHTVQGIEYYKKGVIFYGLGNVLFDQTQGDYVREGIMVRHVFYGKKYIGYETIATYIPQDLQTELADDSRRDSILDTIYQNSEINIK
ncbi:CapA family protein [Candidatus Nomurabacteria bacterium]|nr:CapA family protein [Candidatus Nomurabacteria bacterium]